MTLFTKAIFHHFFINDVPLSVKKPFRILIADNDIDDVNLTRDCFNDNGLPVDLKNVDDGQLLMDYLLGIKNTAGSKILPQLILLDLNMPYKSGLEALKELKQDDMLRKIPVVVLSTSKAFHDIEKAYELGANCYISKPDTYDEWSDKLGRLGKFWIDCVKVYS